MRNHVKKTSMSHASFRRSKKHSRLPIYIGTFFLMMLFGLMFVQHKHKIVQHPLSLELPVVSSKPQLISSHISSQQKTLPIKIRNNTSANDLEYDFYQLLPKMTVDIPESNTAHQ